MPILEIHNLKVERKEKRLLNIPYLSIGENETLSLIGPNGAGKSTLLASLCHLFRHFSGRILFKGMEVGKELTLLEYRKKIGMVFQEPLLFNATVFENVASGLRFRRIRKQEIEKIVQDSLGRFGIAHLSRQHAKTLSGGEAQRTSLARAFAIKPEIILLDEPFSSLDAPTKDSLIDDLEHAIKDLKITAVFATHDRDEALRLSKRIIVIQHGETIQDGTPHEVMNFPKNEFVASFVGFETILSGTVVKKDMGVITINVIGKEMVEAVGDFDPGTEVLLCIKPEDIILFSESTSLQSSARNTFTGTVTRIIPFGLYQKVYLQCGFPLVAYITNTSARSLDICEGSRLKASFKATSVHIIKV